MSSAVSNGLDEIERDELLQRFVPVQVFSYRSVRIMKEEEIGLKLIYRLEREGLQYFMYAASVIIRHQI